MNAAWVGGQECDVGDFHECSRQIDSARRPASQIVFNEFLAYMASPTKPWNWMQPGASELYLHYDARYQHHPFR